MEARVTLSVCPYCGTGCPVLLHTGDAGLEKVTGLAADRHGSSPQICMKGRQGLGFISHPERLAVPLIRREWRRAPGWPTGGPWHWAGTEPRGAAALAAPPPAGDAPYGTPAAWRDLFREATWEEALSLVVQELGRLRGEGGPSAVAGLASAKVTTEENYAFVRLLRGGLGTNSVDHCARLCHAPSVAAMRTQLGMAAATGSLADLDHADVILVAGANTTESHPVIGTRIIKAAGRGATLIVVDPRRTELAAKARLHLRPRPGTDGILFAAMLRWVIATGLVDKAFVLGRTRGFTEAAAAIHDLAPEAAAELTGIPLETIRQAAELYARGPASTTVWAMGLTQQPDGTDTVGALVNLALACGMVGRRGAALLPLRGQNNVQGACDAGALPDVLPGYAPVADSAARARFAAAWGLPAARLTDAPGLRATAMSRDGSPVRGLYVLGENPALSDPDVAHTERWLAGLAFLVVHDLFLTDTARFADVVLPGAAFAEKQGTYVSTERRIQLADAALPPPGEARPELEVLAELAERFGVRVTARSAEETWDELRALVPAWAEASYARLRAEGGLQYPVTAERPDGTPTLHEGRFATPDGHAHFRPAVPRLPDDPLGGDYPFVVATGRGRFHWHTGTMSRRVSALADRDPAPAVEMHPDDATALGLADGERVRVVGPGGKVEVTLSITDRQPPGQLFLSMHFREAAANRLVPHTVDDASGTPPFKRGRARVEAIRA